VPWDFWLIFIAFGVVLPWRGRVRLQKLLAKPRMSPGDRLVLYASTIAFQWLAVAVTAWRARARGLTLDELGLVVHGGGRILLAAIVGTATLGSFQWFNLRRMGRTSGKARDFMQAVAERILPQSRTELLSFLALAVTAGLCEEFLYRGFAMGALTKAGLPVWAVVFVSSVLFGLAHLYQGRGGLVSTLVIGTVFGTARIAYDGLAVVAVWHAAIDVVAGVAGPRYLLNTGTSAAAQDFHRS
jgi:uncharacterized protein